jgi:hypothetical protein
MLHVIDALPMVWNGAQEPLKGGGFGGGGFGGGG